MQLSRLCTSYPILIATSFNPMSATTNPDPGHGAPAFIPLEANPELMTALIHKLGVSPALALHDVYSLTDPDMLSLVPRPALALLLVFPVSAVYESHRLAEDSTVDEYNGRGEGEPVIWWKQTIRNACGIMGLLHAVCNGPARNLIGTFGMPFFLSLSLSLYMCVYVVQFTIMNFSPLTKPISTSRTRQPPRPPPQNRASPPPKRAISAAREDARHSSRTQRGGVPGRHPRAFGPRRCRLALRVFCKGL